jgi:ribose 5-phosphate isomerase B
MKTFKIALGADHAGYAAKAQLMQDLTSEGHLVVDCGAHSEEPSDYPDYALRVAKAVASGRCERGVLVCGSGIGMAIAANKVKGIRAAAPWNIKTAKLSAEHNWANVLSLPARFVKEATLRKMINTWLETPFEKGRHERRIKKILEIESKSSPNSIISA